MITALSIVFRSSRTLPGQLWRSIHSIASSSKAWIFLLFSRAKRREKLRGEQLDVAHAIAQRRKLDLDHREPIVEILAQLAVLERLLEILVRRGDDANVDGDLLLAAEAPHRARLERAQELHLDVGGHLADFVEEERAAVGHLEGARLLVRRAGEGALLVAEQLVLENVLGERGAVEREERPLRAIALLVNRARDELLARAALAEDEDGGGGGRDGVEDAVDACAWLRTAP